MITVLLAGWLGVQMLPGEKRCISSPECPDQFWGPSSLPFISYYVTYHINTVKVGPLKQV